jgi:predicted ATPase
VVNFRILKKTIMSENNYKPELVQAKRHKLFVISGCSGSGKSTLMAELGTRGYRVFHEPGRQVVKEQQSIGGDALPWANTDKFIDLIFSRSIHHMIEAAIEDRVTFFDRSIVEPYNYFLNHRQPVPPHVERAVKFYRYADRVFMSPPWPEIYRTDTERKHDFESAVAEYTSLSQTFRLLGYEIVEIPKLSVAERVDFILARVHAHS